MHHFLAHNLPNYQQECVAVYPSAQIQNIRHHPLMNNIGEVEEPIQVEIICKRYSGNLTVPLDAQPDATTTPTVLAPSSQEHPYMPPEKPIVTPLDNEVCLTWYSPSLDISQANIPADMSLLRSCLVGYAANKRTKRETACGVLEVQLPMAYDLHDK